MKVLHLSEFYSPVGGLEQYLLGMCDACEAAGHPTAVVYSTRMGREPSDRERSVYHIPGLIGAAGASPEARAALSAALDREAPDVVVLHELYDPEIVRRAARRAPTVRFGHSGKMMCPGGRRLWNRSQVICTRPVGFACQAIAYRERCMPRDPRRGLPLITRTRHLGALYRRWSEMVVPSGFMRDLLLANGFAADRVHVVPYFTTLSAPAATRAPVPGRLFCAGRLTPEKGVDHAVRALAELAGPTILVVAGEGPARADVERLAHDLGVAGRVRLAGWLSRERMAEEIQQAQVVLFPSLAPESFGIVGIEAMALARPVVAYDAGGVREWLGSDRTGLLIPRGDLRALIGAVRCLLEDPGRAATLGQRGRAVVEERFRPARHLRDFLAVAERAVTGWRAATVGRGRRAAPAAGGA